MKLLLVMGVAMVFQGSGAFSCIPPYHDYSGRCFYYYGVARTHSQASSICSGEQGGHLVRIRNSGDEALVSEVIPDTLPRIWIGIHDPDLNGVFSYTDGTPLGDHHPWTTVPDSTTNMGCASRMDMGASTYSWTAADCDGFNRFICEVEAPTCNAPWTHYPDASTCLRAFTGRKRTYAQASNFCKDMGGDLATTVTTLMERKRIMKLVKFQAHLFIGVDDTDGDGTYTHINDGSLLGNQRPFRKGRAPAPGRCMTLKKRRWYPKSCTRKFFFVCEKAA